jgi:threonine dehydratase
LLDKITEVRNGIIAAEQRIRNYIRETPLEFSFPLSTDFDGKLYLKCENLQYTGSFKVRGAYNKILTLSEPDKSKGVITASTGNHGMAVAHVLSTIGGNGTVLLPESVNQSKLKILKQFNIKIEFYGQDSEETERYARKLAEEQEKQFISPYNDIHIIAGQGTLGVELSRQLKVIDHVLICVGGGGLVSGVAAYLKNIHPDIKIHGCLPINSPVMYESIKAGRILDMKVQETLSDGSAGGIESDSITFDLCKELIDNYFLVSEEEIQNAIKMVFHHHRLVIEGAAGVAVASFVKNQEQLEGNVVVILCGANIDTNKFLSIVS